LQYATLPYVSATCSCAQDYPDVATEDHDLLADLIAFGDGGFFCNRIVTPVFDVMAYEVHDTRVYVLVLVAMSSAPLYVHLYMLVLVAMSSAPLYVLYVYAGACCHELVCAVCICWCLLP